MDEARRIATFLRPAGGSPGTHCHTARNSAWWVIAELGAWMAGLVNRNPSTLRFGGLHPLSCAAR